MAQQSSYTTKEGDMVDLICWRFYGTTGGVVEEVLKSNPDLKNQPDKLPANLEIKLPTLTSSEIENLFRPWE